MDSIIKTFFTPYPKGQFFSTCDSPCEYDDSSLNYDVSSGRGHFGGNILICTRRRCWGTYEDLCRIWEK